MAESTFTNRILALISVISLVFASCSNEYEQIGKAKQIKKGMTKQEVYKVMGKPDREDIVKFFPPYMERFYYYISPPIFSDDIIVWFDSTGQVGQVSLPKGIGDKE